MADMKTMSELVDEMRTKTPEQLADELREDEQARTIGAQQQLVALSSLQKAVKEKIDTLRQEVEVDMLLDYRKTGSDRRAVKIGNEKVGTVSLRKSKKPYKVVDREAFYDYLLENDLAEKWHTLLQGYEQKVYELLERAANGEDIADEHFRNYFLMEIKPVDKFDTSFKVIGDLVINSETGEAVAGVEPCDDEVAGIMVKATATPLQIIELTQSVTGNALAGLLGD